MAHLNPLISDLALILGVAGITTLLFKKLKQPVVLGYIVAGFLCSGNFLLEGVSNVDNVNIWAEIGIIFLLFSLGLEFSFNKLLEVGGSALMTALVIIVGMMCTGFMAGRLLGWTTTDSVFLGGMLSMSSTTIIIKAFDDLGLRNQKFTGQVFGVLIVEDLFAVVLLVLFSTIYMQKATDDVQIFGRLFKLLFFLVSWFIVAIYLIPTLLARIRRFLNDETLLVISLGLCLGMVVLATSVGFSSALGAFVMGSVLAGTAEAKRIEKVMAPVKDLFGAIFFAPPDGHIGLFSHRRRKRLVDFLRGRDGHAADGDDQIARIESRLFGRTRGTLFGKNFADPNDLRAAQSERKSRRHAADIYDFRLRRHRNAGKQQRCRKCQSGK